MKTNWHIARKEKINNQQNAPHTKTDLGIDPGAARTVVHFSFRGPSSARFIWLSRVFSMVFSQIGYPSTPGTFPCVSLKGSDNGTSHFILTARCITGSKNQECGERNWKLAGNIPFVFFPPETPNPGYGKAPVKEKRIFIFIEPLGCMFHIFTTFIMTTCNITIKLDCIFAIFLLWLIVQEPMSFWK